MMTDPEWEFFDMDRAKDAKYVGFRILHECDSNGWYNWLGEHEDRAWAAKGHSLRQQWFYWGDKRG